VDAATASMLMLNRAACEAMLRFDVHGCTDVTGRHDRHAREMAIASNVTLEIETACVPLLAGAIDACGPARCGWVKNNRTSQGAPWKLRTGGCDLMELLYDPQTSGGC